MLNEWTWFIIPLRLVKPPPAIGAALLCTDKLRGNMTETCNQNVLPLGMNWSWSTWTKNRSHKIKSESYLHEAHNGPRNLGNHLTASQWRESISQDLWDTSTLKRIFMSTKSNLYIKNCFIYFADRRLAEGLECAYSHPNFPKGSLLWSSRFHEMQCQAESPMRSRQTKQRNLQFSKLQVALLANDCLKLQPGTNHTWVFLSLQKIKSMSFDLF